LQKLRQEASVQDQKNLNLRKEIEYQEKLCNEQKDISHKNYKELTRLRELQIKLEKDLDTLHKRVNILHTEVDNNE